MKTPRVVFFALAIVPSAAAAQGITPFWRENPITPAAVAADPVLGNMQSWSLMVSTTGNWGWAGLEAVLPARNRFYNPSIGGNTKPNPLLVPAFPQLEFDTYVTCPGDNGVTGFPAILGFYPEAPGPGDFGGTTGRFSIAWGDLVNDPPGTFEIARWTFPRGPYPSVSRPPQSYASYTAQVNPDASTLIPQIPEPASSLAFIGIAWIRARRCRRR